MACRGGKLYSSGRDMLIKVWDTEDVTRGCIATVKGHTDVVCSKHQESSIFFLIFTFRHNYIKQ